MDLRARLRVIHGFWILILSLAAGWNAQGTSFMARPFPQTVQEAPVIVRGRVGSSHAAWGRSPEESRRIFTYTDLNIEEVIKGPDLHVHRIELREIGGEVGGVGMEVEGSSRFSPGEEVVVLLGNENRDGSFDVRGLMMGKLKVVTDDRGQEVLRGPAIDFQEDGVIGEREGTPQKTWTLEGLRKLVAGEGSRSMRQSDSSKAGDFTAAAPREVLDTASRLPSAPPQEQPESPAPVPPREPGTSPWIWGIAFLCLGGAGTLGFVRLRR